MDLLLKKAKIIVYKENGSIKDSIDCSFNPSQYAIKNSVNYKEDHSLGTDASQLIFLSGAQSELSLSLYFDSVGEIGRLSNMANMGIQPPPVTDLTKKITAAIRVSGSEHKPPMVAFLWGNLNFKGVITSLNETFTMFGIFGKPTRSKMDLTIKAVQDEGMTKKLEPFESPDRTKCRTVVEGMSLWNIAYEEYGDCEKWRVIAKANRLMSPLHLYPGQVLKIPAL